MKVRRLGAFIESVGSLSGRLINPVQTRAASKISGQIVRVRT
jgi:hypothetical protein